MKVLVCGDAMTDVYWQSDVSRVSPEAPVMIAAVQRTERRGGGAANVANNIEAMGVPVERIFSQSQRIEKVRIFTPSQHLIRADFDYPQAPIPCDESYAESLGRCEIVVLIDYGKGSLANVQALITAARQANRKVLIDPKGYDYGKYAGATLIKPNREEMRELVGGWKSQDELDFKARQFLLSSQIDSILLTQGADGMTLYTRDSTKHQVAEAKTLVDVSGAGEAAIAAYAAAIAKGLETPLLWASKAAAIACSRFGTTTVTEAEVFSG